MKLLIDTDIILDVLQAREPHVENSSLIWKLCEVNLAHGCVSSLTFANIVYILRRELTPDEIEDVLEKLSLIFEFTDLSSSDLRKAAAMKWNDFEDALQSVTAEKIQADFIITRNTRDFQNSHIRALTPSEYLTDI